jgi:putative intracellular protease/amidase
VIADNAGSETTDFTIPYGVLKDSGVVDVVSLSTRPGPVQLIPTLKIRTDRTLAEFDASTPRGADIVIVPMMHQDKSPRIIAWVRAQYNKGATVVSICTGAYILARAGLLDGKRATSHWHAIGDLEAKFPNTHWVRDRRYVQDGRVISTTGVTASIPVSLALVEAVAGHAAAARTADRLGVTDWSPAHRSADFSLTFGSAARIAINYLSFLRHETVEAPVANGFDEIGLALASDAWTQSFLVSFATTSSNGRPVRSRHGLVLYPDRTPTETAVKLPAWSGPSLQVLDRALSDIDRRYGVETGNLAALSVEYPRH